MPNNKTALRREIRLLRDSLSPGDIAQKSEALCRRVLETDAYHEARSLYCYLPFGKEVDTTLLVQQALLDGKQVAVPKCYGQEMRFICISDLSQVRPSPFGAPEPAEDTPVACDEQALVIVPGLVFDHRGYRIGYGGGYYDRYLCAHPHHPTIALCFRCQTVPRLEPEAHDIPAQILFSI